MNLNVTLQDLKHLRHCDVDTFKECARPQLYPNLTSRQYNKAFQEFVRRSRNLGFNAYTEAHNTIAAELEK